MKIVYKFVDGEVTEVEVADEIGNVILESRRAEHANNERQRYHAAFSIDAMEYDDTKFASCETSPEQKYESETQRETALLKLTVTQRRRFEMYEDGMSIAEIARAENASFNSVKESIVSAQKRLMKIF